MLDARENEGRDTFQQVQAPIRVMIVDDHAILRAGVREMFRGAGSHVGEAARRRSHPSSCGR